MSHAITSMLGSLARLSAKTDQAEAVIVAHAKARLDEVTRRLEQMRPEVMTDPVAAERYWALMVDRGYCQRVIARVSDLH